MLLQFCKLLQMQQIGSKVRQPSLIFLFKLSGLCGTYDGDKDNDFRLVNGSISLDQSARPDSFSLNWRCVLDNPFQNIPLYVSVPVCQTGWLAVSLPTPFCSSLSLPQFPAMFQSFKKLMCNYRHAFIYIHIGTLACMCTHPHACTDT